MRIDILLHKREARRPTSTSLLIQRVIPATRTHLYGPDRCPAPQDVVDPGRTLWVLHPQGDPIAPSVPPESLQVLLLDGSWREASRMRRRVQHWGALVSLPAQQASRYHLRDQHAPGMYATSEALVMVLETLGLAEAAQSLRTQFELHVYAGLRSRGAIRQAEVFLKESLLAVMCPGVVEDLVRRRPDVLSLSGRRASQRTPMSNTLIPNPADAAPTTPPLTS